MTVKIHYLIGELVSLVLVALVVIALIVQKNFESMMTRNFLDFMVVLTFGLLGSEVFRNMRKSN